MPMKPKTQKAIAPKNQKTPTKDISTENINADDVVFALDIGTRTVIGIVGIYEKDIFKVLAAEIFEHKSRAMMDGQIHDIEKVAEVVREVKIRLEAELGFKLNRVAIAAAGRVLKTSQIKLEYDIEQGREITAEIVGSLEVDAIQQAQQKLDESILNEEKLQFYCVGYSVINYFLNGYVISSLVGHKGKKIGAEVLATFLPHVVVDSLYTVMSRVGLEVISITLEPIAAINITIPKDLRLLNLVLVDVGAGTSDIAVTRDGSVVAYGMVPIAGDEITERLAHELLVDFNTAEKIKLSISKSTNSIKYTDILGKKKEVSLNSLLEIIKPSVETLGDSIAEKIMEFNQKAPNAVFLIGGGSQIPGLVDRIALHLGMSKDRVAVRGRDVIQNVKTKLKKLNGPDSITPFGIAMMAHVQKGKDFMCVTVNGEKVRLFNAKKLTVADSLILIGFNPDKLIGRTGKSLRFLLNGNNVVVKGEHGEAAQITVNNSPANLETVITVGDNINVKPAINGQNAKKIIGDYIRRKEAINITFNGITYTLEPKTFINEMECKLDKQISENDRVSTIEIYTLGDFINKYSIPTKDYQFYINGVSGDIEYVLQDKDEIISLLNEQAQVATYVQEPIATREELSSSESLSQQIQPEITTPAKVNVSDTAQLKTSIIDNIPDNSGEALSEFAIWVNGEKILLDKSKSHIFVDIFSYINFDLTSPKGNIILKLNGNCANFTDAIKPNDTIEVYWEAFKQ